MNVEAEVTIKILDGPERGQTHSFITKGEAKEELTEYGRIETVTLVWKHIYPNYPIETCEVTK